MKPFAPITVHCSAIAGLAVVEGLVYPVQAMLVAHRSASVSSLADVETSTRGSRVIIGANSHVDSFVKIKFAGGQGDIIIGERSYINSGTVIYSGNGVRIGSGVLIAANCTLAPVNHEYRDRTRTILEQRFMPSRGGIIIDDDVWIGAGAVILDGARIQRGAVVGAMSLIRGDLDGYGIYVGNPARLVGQRGDTRKMPA